MHRDCTLAMGAARSVGEARYPPRVARRTAPGCVLAVLGLLAASLVQAQVVKCVDAKGRVEYAKVCPPGSTETSRIQRAETLPPAAPANPLRSAAPAPAGSAKAAGVDPQQLDNAEDNICAATGRLAAARAGLAEGGSVPVEQLAGQKIDDPRRREVLQQRLDAGIRSAQQEMVVTFAKELANYQAEYRRLTGSEFDVAHCNDMQRRNARRDAWEATRREEQMDRRADQLMADEAAGIRAICQQKQDSDGPSRDRAQHLPADYVKEVQERGRAGYARLVASYERTYHKRFDPARCR